VVPNSPTSRSLVSSTTGGRLKGGRVIRLAGAWLRVYARRTETGSRLVSHFHAIGPPELLQSRQGASGAGWKNRFFLDPQKRPFTGWRKGTWKPGRGAKAEVVVSMGQPGLGT